MESQQIFIVGNWHNRNWEIEWAIIDHQLGVGGEVIVKANKMEIVRPINESNWC